MSFDLTSFSIKLTYFLKVYLLRIQCHFIYFEQ